MVTEQKREWVRELQDSITRSSNMVFTDFRGLTVDKMERLRTELYEHESRLEVVKNTLALRAFEREFGGSVDEDDPEETGEENEPAEPDPELSDLPGVGPSKVEALREQGFTTVKSIRDADPEELQETPGIGGKTAEQFIEAARDLLPDDDSKNQSDSDTETGGSEAAPGGSLSPELRSVFQGNTAVTFSGNGMVNMAKVLVEFAEENESLRIKGGLMEGDFLPPEKVEEISKLPTRHELLSSFAVGLNQPIQRLVRGLADPLRKLVTVLDNIKQEKENE